MIANTIKFSLFLLLCRVGSCNVLQGKDQDGPLFLTPYIIDGQLEAAREAAKVVLLEDVQSYSGFFSVNENHDKNLFFWYFPAENPVTEERNCELNSTFMDQYDECMGSISDPEKVGKDEIPVMLWLQGGPGVSSMFGLLEENGPYQLMDDGSLKLREHRWSKSFHMLYIDSPVGTGFSFSKTRDYDQNEEAVSKDLYEALLQFFELFPNLAENKFFIAGESYAGRYVPALGLRIHKETSTARRKINLAGLLIGNGVVDGEFMVYGDYLAQHGLIDLQELPDWQQNEAMYKNALKEKNHETANFLMSSFMIGLTETGVSVYNFLETKDPDMDRLKQFFNSGMRQKIHVGNLPFNAYNPTVNAELLKGDFFMKVSTDTEELLETYRVMHYNGQLDIICHYPMAEAYTNSLNWSGSTDFRRASKFEWVVDQELAGYVKSGGNLYLAMVRDAGHMVPKDRPKWAFDLVTKFVYNNF